ncbi:MAG: class I SAM-dependent methyltransferase [Gammaproteobacteria bacterium]|nr:class I SAM-dependent methyltransferase [Gammaproteobacteria bacterium]NNL49993.1 class I SAM-dependent methyltransferase [Woeseiaceae bacterium]
MAIDLDEGSFRDPRGHIYLDADRVFRTVNTTGIDEYNRVKTTGLLGKLIASNQLVELEEVDKQAHGFDQPEVALLLEHPRLPFISYPYEWGFQQLKSAALLQLDIYLEALRHDVTLSDASAYNIQFIGAQPIFIDHLAFRPYEDGEFWLAHRQFCEQFLNPLLLRAKLGISHNAWYRGTLEGISTSDLNSLLPLRKKLSWNTFSQVVLQAHFQKATLEKSARSAVSANKGLPKLSFERLLTGMRHWIETLQPLDSGSTVWGDYADDNSYNENSAIHKRRFIESFAADLKPDVLWDLGCNTGEYSAAALSSGARYVVGFDFDLVAIDKAYMRARDNDLAFLPLFLDAANPSPNQGWSQLERKGLKNRADCACLLALALVHHLAIGKNIPLTAVVKWLLALAPNGVVEFVPKNDPMVQELLRFRDDIFDDYDLDHFVKSIRERADIVLIEQIQDSERHLIRYKCH